MPGRRTRRRSSMARGASTLSLLAVCCLIIGAVVVLTSNQGCMRAVSSRSTASTQQSAQQPQDEQQAPKAESESSDKPAPEKAPEPEPKEPQEEKPIPPAEEPTRDDEKPESPKPANSSQSKPVTLGSEVSRGSTSSTKIAVTLDAGASAAPTDKILKVLAKHGVRCTFFLTGKWIEKNPNLTRRIVAEGHEIGNHSYSHPRLTDLSEGEITRQIDRTEQLVQTTTGTSTKPLFRMPYGARDKRVLSIVGKLGYRSIYWHVDSWDSVKPGITADQITKRVLSKVGNGSIILMHCGSQATADALDDLLTQLTERGYRPVAVSELLN